MSVVSIFLDKDRYFDKSKKIKNLADIIRLYLKMVPDIDTIYIAGGCYSKKLHKAEELVKSCFGNYMSGGSKLFYILIDHLRDKVFILTRIKHTNMTATCK